MSIHVDARGLNCPQPVIATKRALDSMAAGIVTTIVDNDVAKENVAKFAAANHCAVSIAAEGQFFTLTITKGNALPRKSEQQVFAEEGAPAGKHVFLITRAIMGDGSDELGAVLMKSFFVTMVEKEPLPQAVLFINGGINLTVAGSPVLDHIKTLADQGVEILSCGTCLDYFQLKEQLAIGGITNMYTIMDLITDHKVITI